MNRKAVLIIAAAAAVAAIVVLTTGAVAATSSRSEQPGDGFAAFISCLASHGVQAPSDDPAAVKPWLADHQSDPAVQAALEACAGTANSGAGKGAANGTEPSPTPDALVACLGSHGVQVPSDDPATVKPWLADHQSDPAVQAALEACAGMANTGAGTGANGTEPLPTPDALVACLERHGVDVPSDAKQTPGALKQWLGGAMQQPTVKAALNECAGSAAPNGQKK